MSSRKSRPRGKKGQQTTATYDTSKMLRMIDVASSQNRIFRRRMTGTAATLSTGGGGTLALSTLAMSSQVSTVCPDFASVANLYVAYRCLAMEVQVSPFYPVNTTAVTVPVAIAVAPFQQGTGGTTFNGVLDGSRSKLCSGYRGYKFAASKQGDPEANLWTQVTAAIPAVESYGLQAIGDSPASTASTPVWRVQVWFLVEFRTAA